MREDCNKRSNVAQTSTSVISIHACARIVTFYAGIMSKEEVILIHAYARIAMVQVGRQAGVGTILIHACARIVAGSG